MTSVPIMFYSVFDFEYNKKSEVTTDEKTFMKNYTLYSIGLNHECFDTKIFLTWVAYALIQAFSTYYLCMLGLA
jgi:hypothetical protein